MKSRIMFIAIGVILIAIFAFGMFGTINYIGKIESNIQTITGADTADNTDMQEQTTDEIDTAKLNENLLGAYTINPSFIVETDNFLPDYQELEKMQSEIEKICYQPNQEPVKCIESYLKNYKGNLEFTIGACGSFEEILFETIKENIFDCLKTSDTECVCEFSPQTIPASQTIQREEEYKIKLCNKESDKCKGKYMKLEKPENMLDAFPLTSAFTFGETELNAEEKDYADYLIRYNPDGTVKEAKLGIQTAGKDEIWDYGIFRIYKDKNNKPIIIKDSTGKRECNVEKKIYRFCAMSKTKTTKYIKHGKVVNEKLPIKFALLIADMPPPTIEGLEIQSLKSSDKTLLLSWKKSPAADAVKYRVYYSIADFSSAEIISHSLVLPQGKYFTALDFSQQTAEKYKSIDFLESPECVFTGDKCTFSFNAVNPDNKDEKLFLEEGKLYYIESEERYIGIFRNLASQQYYFAVTAIDKNNNEIDNRQEKQKLLSGNNYNKATPKDSLAPGIVKLSNPEIVSENGNDFLKMEWDAPLNNIDGTPNTERDIASYKVYYEEKDFDSVSALAERINSKTPNAMIPIAGLTSGKTYNIGVIASDIDGNAHKENLATVSIKIP